MKTTGFRAALLAGAIMLAVPDAGHAQAMDGALKAAIYELDKAGGELPRLTPDRKSNIKRLARTLDNAEQSLARSTTQDSPAWDEANQRLETYRGQIDALLNPPAEAAPAPAEAAPVEATAAEMTPADAAPAASEAESTAAAPAMPHMTSSDQARLKRLDAKVVSVRQSLRELDPRQLQFERERTNWRTSIAQLETDIARFEPFMADPNIAALRGSIAHMGETYRAAEAEQLEKLAALGDIPSGIAAIVARYADDKLPRPLLPPFDEATAMAWGEHLIAFAGQRSRDDQVLAHVRSITPLYAIELKNAHEGTVGHKGLQAVNTAVGESRNAAIQPAIDLERRLADIAALDPSDEHLVRNTLMGEGEFEQIMKDIDTSLVAIRHARLIEAAIRQPANAEYDRLAEAVASHRSKIDALFEVVLAEVRMPEDKDAGGELAGIAAEVLGAPAHGYSWERIVVNSGLVNRSELRGQWEATGSDTATVTASNYEWDEFQATTAEKVGEQHFLFYNSFKYYRSGGNKTPLDQWLLTGRIQGSRILPENIGQ